jgi:hypothetical protein
MVILVIQVYNIYMARVIERAKILGNSYCYVPSEKNKIKFDKKMKECKMYYNTLTFVLPLKTSTYKY